MGGQKISASNSLDIGLQRITLLQGEIPLTKLQQATYDQLQAYAGHAYTLSEVEALLEIDSPLPFWSRLDHMEEKGWIKRKDLIAV